MPRERAYKIVIEGVVPRDLAERCAGVWADVRIAAQHTVVPARRVQERKGSGSPGGEHSSHPAAAAQNET